MLINNINNYIASHNNLCHFYYLGIWNELCDIDFTSPKISSKNGKVNHSPDAHYLEDEHCWTMNLS